jgi:plastocyanin
MRFSKYVMAAGAAALVVGAGAGCGDDDDGGDALPAVDGPVSPSFDVSASEMKFDPDAVAVEAGQVAVTLTNDGSIQHDLRIDGAGLFLEAGSGESVDGTVDLEAGSYQFFCTVPGHRDAGMEGVLEVRE